MRVLVIAILLFSCGASEVARPEEVLGQFLEHMERSRSDEMALKDAFRLLDDKARAGLLERAVRAKTLSGGTYEPWQMLVPGQFRISLLPVERGGMRAAINGKAATVIVTGASSEVIEVPMVWERGGWRVVLKLP